jgi:hypothetical protein
VLCNRFAVSLEEEQIIFVEVILAQSLRDIDRQFNDPDADRDSPSDRPGHTGSVFDTPRGLAAMIATAGLFVNVEEPSGSALTLRPPTGFPAPLPRPIPC